MQIVDSKTDQELIESLLAEVAKATNELRCSQADLKKAQNRLAFVLMLSNELLNRSKGQ
jgi:hypothetical protein